MDTFGKPSPRFEGPLALIGAAAGGYWGSSALAGILGGTVAGALGGAALGAAGGQALSSLLKPPKVPSLSIPKAQSTPTPAPVTPPPTTTTPVTVPPNIINQIPQTPTVPAPPSTPAATPVTQTPTTAPTQPVTTPTPTPTTVTTPNAQQEGVSPSTAEELAKGETEIRKRRGRLSTILTNRKNRGGNEDITLTDEVERLGG